MSESESYKVVKVNDGQRIYYQVRKEGVMYPAWTKQAVTVCMADGIATAQEAVKLRDKLSSRLKGDRS